MVDQIRDDAALRRLLDSPAAQALLEEDDRQRVTRRAADLAALAELHGTHAARVPALRDAIDQADAAVRTATVRLAEANDRAHAARRELGQANLDLDSVERQLRIRLAETEHAGLVAFRSELSGMSSDGTVITRTEPTGPRNPYTNRRPFRTLSDAPSRLARNAAIRAAIDEVDDLIASAISAEEAAAAIERIRASIPAVGEPVIVWEGEQ